MLSILIDPARLDGNGLFERETAEFLVSLRKSPVAPGFDKLRIAGDPERETRAMRQKDGITVDSTTWEEIRSAAAKLKMPREELERLAGEK
jgi:uncharacterized oxidoreductase